MPIGTYPFQALSQNQATAANALEQQGANPNGAAEVGMLQAILSNGGPAGGNNSGLISSAGASLTLTNVGGVTYRLTNGGAVTVTFDNSPNIVAAIAGPYLGMTLPFQILASGATTVATPTVTNTGVTLSGTTSVLAGALRWYQAQITQLTTQAVTGVTAGTTFSSLTQIGSTNLYTLALGTNAITSVVGNLIWIGTTAGTLPAGFYPTYSAGTTSIVVALPPSGTAWTATAANMLNAPTTVPVTAAPLITVTGIMATATATVTV